MSIGDFIDSIPAFLMYIMPGFICISTYSFVCFYKLKLDSKVIGSIILSLPLVALHNIVNSCFITKGLNWFGTDAYYIGLFVSAAIIGLLTGMFTHSRLAESILRKLHIESGFNQRFWEDAIKSGSWVSLTFRNQDKVVYGYFEYIENYERFPLIALSRCSMETKTGELIQDHENESFLRVYNLADCDDIQIVPQESKKKKKK